MFFRTYISQMMIKVIFVNSEKSNYLVLILFLLLRLFVHFANPILNHPIIFSFIVPYRGNYIWGWWLKIWNVKWAVPSSLRDAFSQWKL